MKNGALNHLKDTPVPDPDATVTLTRSALDDIMLGEATIEDELSSGAVTVDGDQAKFREFLELLDDFEFWFNIVTP